MTSSTFNASNESNLDSQSSIQQNFLEVKAEAMPVRIPPGVANIVTKLLNGDIHLDLPEDEKSKSTILEKRKQFRLFDKPIVNLLNAHPDPEASLVGNLILRGEEKDVSEALALIEVKLEQDPNYLDYAVIATDPLGRKVKGTLLQIAAMAYDVDLKSEIRGEKDKGLVERVAKIGNLSLEEIALQLQVITSPEAQSSNEIRNKKIMNAVTKFGEGIISKMKEYKGGSEDLKALQNHCKDVIDDLEKALAIDPKEVITSGFILDTAILYQAAKWFEDNISRFNGWWGLQSDVFWVNGFGKLQAKLSARDAQVTRAGIGNLVDRGQMPARTLENTDKSSYFFNASSRLGQDFYLAYYGGLFVCAWAAHGGLWLVENLCRAKTTACKVYAMPVTIKAEQQVRETVSFLK